MTFKLTPKILNQSASTLKEFFITSLSAGGGGGVMWKTILGRLIHVPQDFKGMR